DVARTGVFRSIVPRAAFHGLYVFVGIRFVGARTYAVARFGHGCDVAEDSMLDTVVLHLDSPPRQIMARRMPRSALPRAVELTARARSTLGELPRRSMPERHSRAG